MPRIKPGYAITPKGAELANLATSGSLGKILFITDHQVELFSISFNSDINQFLKDDIRKNKVCLLQNRGFLFYSVIFCGTILYQIIFFI